ncbi:MAG: HAD family hydrolase [Saccharospirillum sp.]
MNHVMFDVDGTLVESYEFDEHLFLESVREITGIEVINNWESYPHVTDRGILQTFIKRQFQSSTIAELERLVKPLFVSKVREYLESHPAREVNGAIEFINNLKVREDVVLSIATGGWGETAIAKLESAGFDVNDITIASSNDHYSRTEIMNLARGRFSNDKDLNLTYFGDAEWDKRACSDLNVNLVIVGNRTSHHQTIADFKDSTKALEFALIA